MHVHRLRGPERLFPVDALEGFTLNRCPDAVSSRQRGHGVVRTPTPENPALPGSVEGGQALRPFRSEVSGIGIADPPGESGLRLGIASVILFLQRGYGIDGVIGRDVGMNDAVPEPWRGFLLQ